LITETSNKPKTPQKKALEQSNVLLLRYQAQTTFDTSRIKDVF